MMARTKIFTMLTAALLGTVFAAPAIAQMAPGSTGSGSSTVVTPSESSPPPMTAPGNGTARRSTGTNTAQGPNDPCPEPKTALSETPDNLAKIQEDITRFTLCVQRAQLLERLNELAQANIETIDSALNLTVGQADGNAVPGIMPAMNSQNFMPSSSPPPIPAVSAGLLEDPQEDMMMSSVPVAQNSAFADSDWRIREITGTGGELSAQLIDDSGSIVRVSDGEALPDDNGRIAAITNTSVEIENNGQRLPLRWVQ